MASGKKGTLVGKAIHEAATDQQIADVVEVVREALVKMEISAEDIGSLLKDREQLMAISGRTIGEALGAIHASQSHPKGG